MKLDFISQSSSKSTLPFAGLSICNNGRLISKQFLLQVFDPNEWCLKNCLLSEGLYQRPLTHESSALTTRLRLLAKSLLKVCFYIIAIHFEKLGIWLVVVDRWLLFRGGRQHRFDCIVFCKNKIFAKFLRDNCQL